MLTGSLLHRPRDWCITHVMIIARKITYMKLPRDEVPKFQNFLKVKISFHHARDQSITHVIISLIFNHGRDCAITYVMKCLIFSVFESLLIAWKTCSSHMWSNWSESFWILITHAMKPILHEIVQSFQKYSEFFSITYVMILITHVMTKLFKIP